MSQEVAVRSQAIDWDDKTAQVLAGTSSTNTPLVFDDTGLDHFFTRTGRRGRLTFVGNSVDAGGEDNVSFHILVNGTRMPRPYNEFQQALGLTYDGWSTLSVPLELPQGACIQVTVDNDDATTAYNAFIRLRVEYEPLN